MPTQERNTMPRRATDERGRIIPMTEDEVRRRAAEVCRGLDALDEMGDEYEQSETLDHLMRALGPDRTLSDRSLFP